MGCLYTSRYNTFLDCASRRRPVYPKVVITFLHNASRRTRRAMHASCESPWHSLAKHHLLGACFPRMAPFRSMLLTLRGGPESLTPRAHQIPVYLMVFSTFLCRAFTAHGPVMVRDSRAIIAIDAPDGDRRAHHVFGHVARQALILRGDCTLLYIGHQAVRILRETGIHQLVDRVGLERLAQHR